ncbi:MAG: helix-turn-helix domain-containing protein [Acidimicrobiales bacterium]
MDTREVFDEPAATPTGEHAALLLTVRQAAAMLQLGRSTVYGLIGRGDLEVVHVGRAVRVPTAAVAELVERLRANTPRRRNPAA